MKLDWTELTFYFSTRKHLQNYKLSIKNHSFVY